MTQVYSQTVASREPSMMYNLTYMATAQNFDKHTADVDRIVAAFSFR